MTTETKTETKTETDGYTIIFFTGRDARKTQLKTITEVRKTVKAIVELMSPKVLNDIKSPNGISRFVVDDGEAIYNALDFIE